jgi:hypothetical protein
MPHHDFQIFLNSGPVIFIMVRYAEQFAAKEGRLQLIGFLTAVLVGNALFNMERFSPFEAVLRALGCSAMLFVCIFGLARYNARRRERKAAAKPGSVSSVTAADRPAAPPGPAP